MSREISPFEQIRRVNSGGNEFRTEDHFVDITDMVGISKGDWGTNEIDMGAAE